MNLKEFINTKKQKLNSPQQVTIVWFSPMHSEKSVQLIGSFTNPPWKEKLDMGYHVLNKAFQITVSLKHGTCFQFVVDGHRKVSMEYSLKRVFLRDSLVFLIGRT